MGPRRKFNATSIPEDIANIKFADSTLGDINFILSKKDRESSEIKSFLGEGYQSVGDDICFYTHNILQYNQEAFFKKEGYKKIRDFSLCEDTLTEAKMSAISSDLDVTFLGYVQGYICYEGCKAATKNKKLIVFIAKTYDGRSIFYTIFANSDSDEIKKIFDNWKSFAKENNFYKGKKIDGGCNFLKLNKDITWDNVILTDKVKAVIQRNVSGLYANRKILEKNGISIKRGIIFSGAPGGGKTLICKVLCQELPITVIYILPSDIREPSDVSRICGMASDLSPTLLVLEDIDYIAEDRSNGSGMAWMTIELMNRLDGLEEMNGVITIATTNLIEKLENAVKNRPGRFDKVITIPEPDASCRKKMIQKFTEKFSIKEVNVDALVKKTKGMLGSYIKHLCEYAAILAIEESSFDSEEIAIITEKHFEEALSEIKNKDFSVAPDYEPKRPMGFGSGPFDDDEL